MHKDPYFGMSVFNISNDLLLHNSQESDRDFSV